LCSTAGPDAEENGTDGTARRGATWRPSKAFAAGLGAQGKGDRAARFAAGIAVSAGVAGEAVAPPWRGAEARARVVEAAAVSARREARRRRKGNRVSR